MLRAGTVQCLRTFCNNEDLRINGQVVAWSEGTGITPLYHHHHQNSHDDQSVIMRGYHNVMKKNNNNKTSNNNDNRNIIYTWRRKKQIMMIGRRWDTTLQVLIRLCVL